VPTLAPHIKAGRLRALAVTSAHRASLLPDVPTFSESGLPGVDISPLFGVIAPAGVSADIIDKLSRTLGQSIHSGELHKKLTGMGFDAVGSTPAEFSSRIRSEVAKWKQVIERGGIKAE
jgi:tripartite-type tricarboxylate transporter receptor subunit TctC